MSFIKDIFVCLVILPSAASNRMSEMNLSASKAASGDKFRNLWATLFPKTSKLSSFTSSLAFTLSKTSSALFLTRFFVPLGVIEEHTETEVVLSEAADGGREIWRFAVEGAGDCSGVSLDSS